MCFWFMVMFYFAVVVFSCFMLNVVVFVCCLWVL